jgi:hypothetical protein
MLKVSSKCSSVGCYHGHYWRTRGSKPGFPTSPYLKCASLATRLLDIKKGLMLKVGNGIYGLLVGNGIYEFQVALHMD